MKVFKLGWDSRFQRLARMVATWSKDPSTQTGCVIVKDNRVISMGFNGFPSGIEDSYERLNDREVKYKYVLHAEANALLSSPVPLQGATAYVTLMPCSNCALQLVQAGIKRVVVPPTSKDHLSRWKESFDLSKSILEEAGVTLDVIVDG